MIRLRKSKKLKFKKAYEINGVSPLSHYYEEIYTNLIGLPAIGIRGDKNYLFYGHNGLGTAYYEEIEKKLAADSVYKYFQKRGREKKFFDGITNVIDEIRAKIKEVEKLNLDRLGVKKLARLFLEINELHGKIFSYYMVSQPYRMQRFESSVVSELEKRVAASRINNYMTVLGTSNEPTKLTAEELAWLDFVIKYKTKYPSISPKLELIKADCPDMYADLMGHFEQYKILTLGDGNWEYNLEFFMHNLRADYKKDIKSLEQRLVNIKKDQHAAKEQRRKLINDLYLDEQTVNTLDFLAKMGHYRLAMRIEGWIPLVMTNIKVGDALYESLGERTGTGLLMSYMLPEEIKKIAKTGSAVSDKVLIERMGDKKEFLILNDNGKYRIFYGSQATAMFKDLVPPINHKSITELRGSAAVRGRVTGKACVYKWGDDIGEKQKLIQKNHILIAGQTRPAMMPIIRLAKGIVTDEGGVTSHAAIVSRELGIPSVIGTIHATQVFKDGDMVELDADHGIVRKLS